MGFARKPDEGRSIADLLGSIVDGMARLVSEHLALARLELASDARQVGRLVLFAVLVLVGYAFLCSAAALFLTRWLSLPAALLVVGTINVLAGAVGIQRAVVRMRARPVMNGTIQELNRSSAMLASGAEPNLKEVSNVR